MESARLPVVQHCDVLTMCSFPNGLPRIDWELANTWIAKQGDEAPAPLWRKAVVSAFLDVMCERLELEHVRWRTSRVEGIAPRAASITNAAKAFTERCLDKLGSDLRPIRGEAPIPPVAIVLIEPLERYIDLTDGYMPDEVELGSSGGMYLYGGPEGISMVAVHGAARWAWDMVVAHELTHHCLVDIGLPLWAEEGIARMMDERLARFSDFALTREIVAEHRSHWDESNITSFLDGTAFYSAEGHTQRLAYQLARWVLGRELTLRPSAFFGFLRDCRNTDPDSASQRHLGCTTRELALNVLRH